MTNRASLALTAATIAAVFGGVVRAADVDVIDTQTSFNATYGLDVLSANTTWTKDNVYILTDRLYIPNGLTLTIEPGTKIYSTSDDQALIGDPVDDTVGAVIVARGGKIEANGTAAEPIIFDALQTLEAERGCDLPYDSDSLVGPKPTVTTNGLWGGIVVLGNAYIAVTDSSGNNIGNKIIEGFVPSGFVDSDSDTRPDILEYGFDTLFAQDDADDSGTISHVSIRHGGYTFGTDNEINGLTLAGVGSGTTIEYVEVVANQDDGVEFFGGTVNTNNIVVAFCGDDSFDIDEGHQGTHQFWFAIQNPNDGDNLGEWDGVGGSSKGSTNAGVIRSNPQIFNATFVGPGADSFTNANAGKDNGIFMDDFFNGQVINSVLLDSVNHLTEFASDGDGGGIVFTNNTIGDFGRYNDIDDDSVLGGSNIPDNYYVDDTFFEVHQDNTAPNTAVGFTDYMRAAGGWLKSIDPRPMVGSSPLVGAVAAGAPVAAAYRGAFDGTTNWAAGWTFLDENGYFGAALDTDGDGLTDAEEGTLGTNPSLYDTDGDGVSDGFEVANASKGFDPLVSDATAVLAGLASSQELLNIGYFANTIDQTGSVLTLELEGSTTLGGWTFEQDVNVPLPSGTKFYRFTDGN